MINIFVTIFLVWNLCGVTAKCVIECDMEGICRVAEGAICEFIGTSNAETSNNNKHQRQKRSYDQQDTTGKGNNSNLRSAIFVLSERCGNVLRCGEKDVHPIPTTTQTTSVITCCSACLRNYPPCVSISFNNITSECRLWNFLGLPHNDSSSYQMIYYSIKSYFTDCSQIHSGLSRAKSGRYAVTDGTETFLVICEIDNNEGWTVLQRRQNKTFNFNRTWDEYKRGFGDLNADFWIGNEFIQKLTSGGQFHLRIKVQTISEDVFTATYGSFSILQESDNYELSLGDIINEYGGVALTKEGRTSFSTYDRDNDRNGNNCASEGGGGWWFNSCSSSCFINGLSLSFNCDINEKLQQLSRSLMMIKRV